jgi:uncharacterized peroxidase-related enzyme
MRGRSGLAYFEVWWATTLTSASGGAEEVLARTLALEPVVRSRRERQAERHVHRHDPRRGRVEGVLAEYYKLQKGAWGFLPNFAAAFSTRPEVAMAWGVLNKTVRDGMDRRRFEIATICAARALRSAYCTAAHSTFLRDACDDEPTMIAIAEDPSGAGLSSQDRAVYQFAARVAKDAASIEQSDVDRLLELGLSDGDVADVVFAAAARCFFTRVLDGLGAQLDVQTAATFAPEILESMIGGTLRRRTLGQG